MTDKLVEILKSSGVHAWEVTDVCTRGWEFYYIRRALDQHRAKDVEHISVKVFQLTGEGTMGSAAAELHPTASVGEARELVRQLAYRATLAPDPAYDLVSPGPQHLAAHRGAIPDLAGVARDFMDALASVEETPGEDINSSEIFVSAVTRRFINSMGVDVTETYPTSMLETVINARNDKTEIELYRMLRCGTCDASSVRDTVQKAMRFGRDRLLAVPTPELGSADVLFTGEDSKEIYAFFCDRLDAGMAVRQMTDWKPGVPIAGDIKGDRVTLKAVRSLENSPSNRAFDSEGSPIKDVVMMENGVPQRYLGGRMFSHILGLEESFIPTNYVVEGGTAAMSDIRRGRYLEVVEFSDFQVDEITGDMFGEIRLAYLCDGDTVTPVTGGSVSGSMPELLKDMRMTRESELYGSMSVPAATLLKGVTVTGVRG